MPQSSRILFICIISILTTLRLEAQSNQLKWLSPIMVLDSNFKPTEVLHFDGAQLQKNLLPYYVVTLHNIAVENFSFTSTQYEALSNKEISILKNKPFSEAFNISIGVQNKKPVSEISFIPLRKNPQTGQYEKLISFSYQYTSKPFTIPSAKSYPIKQKRTSSTAKTESTQAAGSSVLASGDWYKISISASGIHRIDYNFLKSTGINPDAIDPRRIRIFGNGGEMLPQANIDARPDDLIENAIFISGESDGNFGTGDFILFYAKGPNSWKYNSTETIFNHSKNIYSENSFYFITVGTSFGARVTNEPDLGSGAQTITIGDDYDFIENDLTNIINSGREWYGESFEQTTNQSFTMNTPGIVAGSTLKLTSSVLGRSTSATSFNVTINNTFVGSQSIGANNLSTYDAKGKDNRTIHSHVVSGSPAQVTIGLTFNKGSSFSSIGHLNYLALNYKRTIGLYGNQTNFRALASTSTSTSTFQVNNGAGSTIWNVTDISAVKSQAYSTTGLTAIFSANSSTMQEYIVFNNNGYSLPQFVSKVDNQNIHAVTAPSLPDLVIISHPNFLTEASRLADFRRSHDNLGVWLLTTDQVYNEFSSGAQDVTAIRDLMKMLYDRKTSTDSVRYLLLFGDCSYDFKNRISGNTNFVPTYQSRESLYPLTSYSSDDYFGFLDNTEGNWGESPSENDKLDIGIGRIPVKTVGEAKAVVDKLIHYNSNINCIGKWRNRITFVADDGDGNLHQSDAEDLSVKVDTSFKQLNIQKIFLDAYNQQASPGGEKAPEVNDRIDQTVNNGTFILNYSGHGGETGWAQEAILGITQIESWDNLNTLPFMITATCDFGRLDDPAVVSGAEYSLIRPNGGSIGIISSARVVYAFSNKALNIQIYNYIFKSLNDGSKPRLGDVMRQTKNISIVGVNNRNYTLIGDPSLRLSYPSENIAVTEIKGITVSAVPDTLKALNKVTIKGEIKNTSGVKLTNFSGKLSMTVYDKKNKITTKGTEGSAPFTFGLRNNFLFDGTASVTNGDWTVSFVVPKDISYQYDFGKISTYAFKEGTIEDAGGYYTNVIIGGTDPNAPPDNTPPVIRLFMNDESFVFGGLTNKDALFIAKLSDENGINTAGSGIGHELAATLDNSETPIVLNEFYTANLNDYKNGSVNYPLKDLTIGPHTMRFKAWDTYNNSAETYLEFVVANDEKIALSHILNYPNPFSTNTEFHFDHNRAGEELDIMIQIYTISGKLIKTLDTKVVASNAHFTGLNWNGRDDFGDKIGRGVYVYRVWVRAPRDGSSIHKYEKLVILN